MCANQIDRLVGSEVNARRMHNVEACFGSSGIPLVVPGRVLVGEGVLVKVCRKKPKPRQFFLCNDVLVYGNILISKRKYNKQHVVPLEEVSIEDIPDEPDGLTNGFLVKTRTKSFAVHAGTASEKREWITHIQRCINDLLKNTGKTPAKEHAAVWVPDVETKLCMACKKTQFTLIIRKHHCRACGKVVCNACSTNRVTIPTLHATKPVRVCTGCFDSITSSPNQHGDPARNSHVSIRSTQHDESDSAGSDDSDDDGKPAPAAQPVRTGLQAQEDDQTPTFYGTSPRG